MHGFILWCGFFGAWLLVAGPVYQAALELDEEQTARDAIESAKATLSPTPRPSAWWWLIPPVGWWKNRQRSREQRVTVMESLSAAQLSGLARFMNKATGWLYVALGALLIAVKESWELVEYNEWPSWLFWVLVVLMPVFAAVNTAARMAMTHGMVDQSNAVR